MGLVRHFVGFRYSNTTTAADKAEVVRRYTALYNLCTRPSDGQPYIVSFDAGMHHCTHTSPFHWLLTPLVSLRRVLCGFCVLVQASMRRRKGTIR